jgi:hypothetical protein
MTWLLPAFAGACVVIVILIVVAKALLRALFAWILGGL